MPVVAVASGKGGVGKTTAAVNLTLALSAAGVRTGLVDADLYGPDAAHMMGRLISGTSWTDLDCLVVDLPPGTADVQQLVFGLRRRPTFVLLVVTPQVVAHRDAHRLLASLARGQAVVLGGIENMAGQVCPSCGETTALSRPRRRTRPSGPRCPSWPACRSARWRLRRRTWGGR